MDHQRRSAEHRAGLGFDLLVGPELGAQWLRDRLRRPSRPCGAARRPLRTQERLPSRHGRLRSGEPRGGSVRRRMGAGRLPCPSGGGRRPADPRQPRPGVDERPRRQGGAVCQDLVHRGFAVQGVRTDFRRATGPGLLAVAVPGEHSRRTARHRAGRPARGQCQARTGHPHPRPARRRPADRHGRRPGSRRGEGARLGLVGHPRHHVSGRGSGRVDGVPAPLVTARGARS